MARKNGEPKKLTKRDVEAAAERLKNRGKWGKDDQPCHWICIPIMGLTMGEIFKLDVLSEACAKDRQWDFFFCGPALPITGTVGSPINPVAIR